MVADHEVDVVVIGAGQAGLSAAYFLQHFGFTGGDGFVVLDHGKRPGGAWQYRWPSLRLDRVHGIHQLPGMSFDERDGTRPASEVVSAYFASYEGAFDLPVRRPVGVRAGKRARANSGTLRPTPVRTGWRGSGSSSWVGARRRCSCSPRSPMWPRT